LRTRKIAHGFGKQKPQLPVFPELPGGLVLLQHFPTGGTFVSVGHLSGGHSHRWEQN
jgi:hypothetical protein